MIEVWMTWSNHGWMNWGVSQSEKNCVKMCEEYVFIGLKDLIQNNVLSKGL